MNDSVKKKAVNIEMFCHIYLEPKYRKVQRISLYFSRPITWKLITIISQLLNTSEAFRIISWTIEMLLFKYEKKITKLLDVETGKIQLQNIQKYKTSQKEISCYNNESGS